MSLLAKFEESKVNSTEETTEPKKNTLAKKKSKISLLSDKKKKVDEPKVVQHIEEETEEEAVVAEETVEEKDETEVKAEEVKAEETKEEEKPKKTRGRKPKKTEEPKKENKEESKTEAKAETKESAEIDEVQEFIMPRTEVDFETALAEIVPQFESKEWNKQRTEIQDELNKVVIPIDPNNTTILELLSQLSQLRQKVNPLFMHYKAEHENINMKEPEGLIERVKRVNMTGSNESVRRRNGVLACMSYKGKHGVINLYEMGEEIRRRYTFLRYTMENIDYQSRALITMSAALKLEMQHMPSET